MTSQFQVANRTIDIGLPAWCWARLEDADKGILSYETLHGRASLAVPCVVIDHQIMIPLASFNDTGWLAVGREAMLEVTGIEVGLGPWLVRATGVALRSALLATMDLPLARHWHPATGSGWPGDGLPEWLVLPPVRVRGYYETSTLKPPAVDESGAHDLVR